MHINSNTPVEKQVAAYQEGGEREIEREKEREKDIGRKRARGKAILHACMHV